MSSWSLLHVLISDHSELKGLLASVLERHGNVLSEVDVGLMSLDIVNMS